MISLQPPFAIYLGNVQNPLDAKTGFGIAQWRREECVAQTNRRTCSVDLGLPSMNIAQAKDAGARTLIIGVAPSGGKLPHSWQEDVLTAVEAGLHVASGLHQRLNQIPELVQAAEKSGSHLIDVRDTDRTFNVASGRKRSGKRILTVGTDCCVGKKYSALAIHRALVEDGVSTDFRASGQTGILISGSGIPIDAVISDFISGAAEELSPDNDADHWDVIEGQGAIYHPGYAAVTLGLLHGSQPDALVLCHDHGRNEVDEYPDFPIPSIEDHLQHYLILARLTNKNVRWAGICLNTSHVHADDRQNVLAEYERLYKMPCVDPLIDGVGDIVAQLR